MCLNNTISYFIGDIFIYNINYYYRMKYFNLFQDFNLLQEGLIKTHDSDKAIKYLLSNTTLIKSDIWITNTQNDTVKINIDISRRSMEDAEKIVNMLENVYGWYLAKINYDFYDDEYDSDEIKNPSYEYLDDILVDEDDTITFIFEAKYDKEYKGSDTTLYHVTDKIYIDKIIKTGLIPKTKSKISVHPDRVYLMLTYKSIETLLENPNINIDNPVILEIDISDLDIKLYLDPNMPEAVYTYSNIPPKNIKIR